MRVHAKIQKWGNGLALRVSGVMRDIPHFQEGTEVDVDVSENGLFVIKSTPNKKSIFPFSESQLVQGLNDGQNRSDLRATPLTSEIEL
jgi:antitoxin MazE